MAGCYRLFHYVLAIGEESVQRRFDIAVPEFFASYSATNRAADDARKCSSKERQIEPHEVVGGQHGISLETCDPQAEHDSCELCRERQQEHRHLIVGAQPSVYFHVEALTAVAQLLSLDALWGEACSSGDDARRRVVDSVT